MSDTDSQTDVLTCIQVLDPGDPAIDRASPGVQKAISDYIRTRSPAALEELLKHCHSGQKPWRYQLSPLSVEALVWCSEGTAANRLAALERAFRCACFEAIDPQDRRHRAPMHTDGTARNTFPEAKPEWTAKVTRELGRGLNVVRELGAVALRRAEVTDEVSDPYGLLPGAPRPAF